MNEALKDVSLFDKLVENNEIALEYQHVKTEDMLELIKTDTGRSINEKMEGVRKWVAENFSAEESPLWPKHGNNFNCELFEARCFDLDDFVLVWRDVAFAYYKRFGRCTFVSRALTDDEASQFITEITAAVETLAASKPPHDPLAQYRPAEEPLPKDPTERKRAVAMRQEADKAIAELDAREGYYSFDERRVLLAQKNNYTPTLKPVPSLQRLHDILEVLRDDDIPEKRP